MGAYKSLYVGGFIKVKAKIVDELVYKMVHPTNNSRHKMGVKFCPETGALLVKTLVATNKVKQFPCFYDEPTLEEDALFAPAYTGYENQGTVFLVDNENHEDSLFSIDLSNVNFVEKLTEFKEQYQDHINFLIGNNWEFEVGYGIVYYAH